MVSSPRVFLVATPLDHIAALCVEHAVSELPTLDADIRRFPSLRRRNPFSAGPARSG